LAKLTRKGPWEFLRVVGIVRKGKLRGYKKLNAEAMEIVGGQRRKSFGELSELGMGGSSSRGGIGKKQTESAHKNF